MSAEASNVIPLPLPAAERLDEVVEDAPLPFTVGEEGGGGESGGRLNRLMPTARWVLGQAVVACQGFGSWARRVWDGATLGVYRRQMTAAEAAGDVALLAEWTERRQRAATMRHQRLMDLPRLARGVVIVAAGSVAGLVALLLVMGLLAWLAGAGSVLGPILVALTVAGWVLTVVAFAWTPALVLAPVWVVLAAWREGRRRGTLPAWAVSPAAREEESVVITPAGIAGALAHLGIAPLNKAIKAGWTVEFETPPVRVNGRGYQAVFSLPMGCTPDMIADRGEVLARNLSRAPLEVWPTAAGRAGFVDLWVADPGATEKPAPEYPLLHGGVCDVFAGVPLGVSQRGEVIAPPLPQNNIVFGGLMGQGKSNGARITMLGAALDPLAELWVYVFANNGDFDAYQPRLARYDKGVDDAVCAAALASLHELYGEVARREERLAELGAKKVTRALAERNPDLRPIVALFSECHELFGHEEFGKEAADVATKTLRRARKTAITLMFDTQSSRADAIPPKIVELVAINACFAVKTWRSNDGFLGDGSFQAGIRATELRAGKDRGTSVLTGATPERFEILKWFFAEVDDDTGYDAATEVIARAMQSLHPAVPTVGDRPVTAAGPVTRDLLEDLGEVLGDQLVPAADVPPLLARLAPQWAPYRRMTGKALRGELGGLGVKVASTGNRWPVDPAVVRAALARRATADLDGE
ncbi:MAG: cell division protein FtsK [Pseudonocardiaceae bacterium]